MDYSLYVYGKKKEEKLIWILNFQTKVKGVKTTKN